MSFRLCLCLLAFTCLGRASIFFPQAPKCGKNGLCEVTSDVGLSDAQGPVVAVCDWNGDRFTDLLTLVGNELWVYLWGERFSFSAAVKVALPFNSSAVSILGVVAQDMDNDGRLDLVVTTQAGGKKHVSVVLREDEFEGLQVQGAVNWTAEVDDEVLMANLFGRGAVDFFGSANGERTAWENAGAQGAVQLSARTLPRAAPVTPNPSSIVDVDGDCVADLVTVTRTAQATYLELAVQHLADLAGSAVSGRFQTLAGLGLLAWADFDSDGDLDLIAPVKAADGAWRYILVLYNQRSGSCGSALCCPSNFAFHEFDSAADPAALLTCSSASGYLLVDIGAPGMAPRSYLGSGVAPRVRIGDYNIDGYPDLLIVATGADSAATAQLWRNAACEGGACDSCGSSRTLEHQQSGTSDLEDITDVVDALFYTFNEEGSSDLIVITEKEGKTALRVLMNGFFNDAFFFKAAAATGRSANVQKLYGAALPGAVFQFTWSDLNSKTRVQAGVQSPTSTHLSLDLPYVFFGLGRTYSYIEEFHCGAYNQQTTASHSWTGVIPNSNVFVTTSPMATASDWSIETFVVPSHITILVALTVCAMLLIIATPILILLRRERRQDEAVRKSQAPIAFR